ncbi:2-amino-4-hydroxy-6-hydroxymethyldihydropteridine diphosphokinase [Gammaproteobacteria bacterium]|jgi:2-amino-4-hydroxy-6-hydroxymethyldihydropteridine diphosphokinase|nr:2-amino-4-hydroxy-6-hydroxymethyldihydropteridine diphosphokinase [Gammaproteobacteria bacterium]MDC0442548.1 2-amino-4-hydroxy-6-hydroxymethyldihydropteridine diphosphokinase [Gammaproteobacteria bacterium]
MKYYLSLGSNINPESNLELAISALNKILTETECSSIYQTQAEGFEGDDFLNLIFSGVSSLAFEDLNKKLKDIEDSSGRDRNAKKFSSRTLDIDIVLQLNDEEEILFESDEIAKYRFVSEPLEELL